MKKILIVEDEDFLVDAYQAKLTNPSYQIDIARDGFEAIKKIDENIYDLFILDLIIPGVNGLEVLTHIRASEAQKNTPVVIASNIEKNEVLGEALKLGVTEYFVKSDISLSDLQAKINALLT